MNKIVIPIIVAAFLTSCITIEYNNITKKLRSSQNVYSDNWYIEEHIKLDYSELRDFDTEMCHDSNSDIYLYPENDSSKINALGVKVKFTNNDGNESFSILLKDPIEIKEKSREMTFWWIGRCFNEDLNIVFSKNGKKKIRKVKKIDFGGWKEITYSLDEDYDYFLGFNISQQSLDLDRSRAYFYYFTNIKFEN